jgi:hypothetical protein
MDPEDVPELLLSGGQLIVVDKLGNSPFGWDFSRDYRNRHEDDRNERDWPPNSAPTLYCAADHRPQIPVSVQRINLHSIKKAG